MRASESLLSVFRLLLPAVLLAILPLLSAATANAWDANAAGNMQTATYTNSVGSRLYHIFIPPKLADRPGVLVVLHGCFMSPEQMASGTDLNRHATEHGFIVVYPEQNYIDNAWKCWNWFMPENQRRNTGESSIIVGLTRDVVKRFHADPNHVFITGISAGGAMASNILGCYSDVFSGALLQSGLEFAAAQNEDDAHVVAKDAPTHDLDAVAQQALSCSPPRKTLLPVIVVQGAADPYVNPINADRTALLFAKINAAVYGSLGGQASGITQSQTKLPVIGQKYAATFSDVIVDGRLIVREVMVDGMGHGWSGGKPGIEYMEPRGVDASQMLVDAFFPTYPN